MKLPKGVCGALVLTAATAFAQQAGGWELGRPTAEEQVKLRPGQLVQLGRVSRQDVQDIQMLVDDIENAWQQQNVDEIVQRFAPNATYLTPRGILIRGHDQLQRHFGRALERFADMRLRLDLEAIRMPAENLAFVDVLARMEGMGGGRQMQMMREQGMHITALLTRRAGEWQILDARAMPMMAPARPGVGGAGEEGFEEPTVEEQLEIYEEEIQ